MNEEMESVSLWAILPARVRYDRVIPPNAKLLFAEIAAKTNAAGYCFAGNQWFMDRFGFSEDTIRNLIRALAEAGYITLDIDNTRKHQKRRIYLTGLAFSGAPPDAGSPLKNSGAQPPKDFGGTPLRTSGAIENIKNKINPPIAPQELQKAKVIRADVLDTIGEVCEGDGLLLLAWIDYAEMRYRKKKPIETAATVTRTDAKLRRLAGNDHKIMIEILHQSTDNTWTGVFALKGAAPREGGSYWADDPEG